MFPENQTGDHEEIKRLLQENQRLLIENNQMLRRARRSVVLAGLLRFLWFVIIIVTMAYVYFIYVKPNLDTLNAKISALENVGADVTNWQSWYEANKSILDGIRQP